MVLIFVEIDNGSIKKTSLEAVYYGAEVAKMQGSTAVVLAIGKADAAELAKAGGYGATKVFHANNSELTVENAMAYSSALVESVKQSGADVVILPKSGLCDAMSARAAAKLGASVVSGVVELPDLSSGFKVKRGIYTGKAFATVELKGAVKILGVKKNAVVALDSGETCAVEGVTATLNPADFTAKITKQVDVV
jgi:electron transfer flavoprotein alpha subunit